ncbi:MAG: formylglycine-generating enzyme family protein [Proteobacteria bacterium]|nr:formylglycine-generating enzyme family protein [Pseudomonadota bacterium]
MKVVTCKLVVSNILLRLFLVLIVVNYSLSGCTKKGNSSDTYTDDDDLIFTAGIRFVSIPPGTFEMGSPVDEYNHYPNERLHTVSLTHSFQIATTELTWKQAAEIDPSFDVDRYMHFSSCDTLDCPVWMNAVVYNVERWADELSAQNGLEKCYADDADFPTPYHCNGFRMPTEAEWEYAARAGTQTMTYAGDYTAQTLEQVLGPIACWEEICEVGSKEPNAFGLYDMIGNPSEVVHWIGTYGPGPDENPFYGSRGLKTGMRAAGRYHPYDWFNYDNDSARLVRTLPGSELTIPQNDDTCPEFVNYDCSLFDEPLQPWVVPPSDDSRFVDLFADLGMPHIILGETDDGEQKKPFVVLMDYWNTGYEVISFSHTAGQVLAVEPGSLSGISGNVYFLLLCGELDCYLAKFDPQNPSTLETITNGIVPNLTNPVDIAVDGGVLYVVGDGIVSFDGFQWQVEIEAESGTDFSSVDITREDDWVVAVGGNGRMVVKDSKGWSEIDSGTTANLNDVRCHYNNDLIAVGDDGVFIAGTASSPNVCDFYDEDLVSVEGFWPNKFIAISASGQFVKVNGPTNGSPPCTYANLSGTILDTAQFTCGIEHNDIVLTPQGLYFFPYSSPDCGID